jgi:type II secretory pathway pseudopilin PulG
MNPSTSVRRVRALRQEGGFAILEALIALLVVAFGMLALAAFQFTLARASDVAKQRTEATRIAEREIDLARSFVSRAGDGNPSDGRLTYVEDLAVGTLNLPNVTGSMTNTTFRPQRIVSAPTAPVPAGGEPYRWVNVIVRWDDRNGVEQSVNLSTVISDGVPSDLGSLANGRGYSTTLRPKNRHINIPYPAVNLAGGQLSAFVPPPGTAAFTFENTSGRVVSRCSSPPLVLTENMPIADLGTCTAYANYAYILSGYVRFKTSNPAADRDNIDSPSDLTDATRGLYPTTTTSFGYSDSTVQDQPININSSATGNAPLTYECYAQRQLTIRSNATQNDLTIAEGAAVPQGYSANNAPRFIAYMCVVQTTTALGSSGAMWSGLVTLRANGWSFGTSGTLGAPAGDAAGAATGTGQVCRFTSDYNGNGQLSNNEHPQYYREIKDALDNQNYLVVDGEDSCPPDIAANPAVANYQDTNTVQHQPALGGSGSLSHICLALANNGPNSNTCVGSNWVRREPIGLTAALPME